MINVLLHHQAPLLQREASIYLPILQCFLGQLVNLLTALLLSDIQRDGKNVVGYYQSKAEYHFLLGQYEEAISQLEFALQLTKNNFQVSESVMTKIIDIKNKINKSRGL